MDGDNPGDTVQTLREIVAARPVEDRLLLAAARLHPDETVRDQLQQLLEAKPDWARVVEKAEVHWVAPLLYRTLSQQPFASLVPRAALARLHGSYLANGASNLLWLHQLHLLVAAFNRSDIPVVLLKGSALLHTVFPDPALRQLRDLDLLVHRRNLPVVEKQLQELGYIPAEEQWPFGKWPPEWYEKKYVKASTGKRGTLVEIHWQLARRRSPFRIDVERLMENSEPVRWDGVEAGVLGPIHQILHLCTHLAYNDGFGVGLSRLSDLHETVERFSQRLDWGQLLAEARRLQAYQCLRYSLAAAAALFGTKLPPRLLERARERLLRLPIIQQAVEGVLDTEREPVPLPSTLVKMIAFDRVGLGALLQMLLPRPHHLRHAYRLLKPQRIVRALRYARSMR